MLAAAASVLMMFFAGYMASGGLWTADYRTAAGEQRRIKLDDGSSVLLDTATSLDIDYSDGQRNVYLHEGQALFQVAHDSRRPFVVHDGAVTATAVGTVYAVRHDEAGPRITVREGRVAVTGEGSTSVTLVAGEQVAWSAQGIEQVTVDTASALAWERGVLLFKLTPLREVIAEIDRHRRGVIFIVNADILDMPVSGMFRIDEIDGSLASLANVFPLEVTQIGGYVAIVR